MQCKMRFSFCSHPVDNKRTIKMGCLPLPLPLLETCVIFLTSFAGLAWKSNTCYFADLSEVPSVLWG